MWQFWVCEGEKIGKKREKGVWQNESSDRK